MRNTEPDTDLLVGKSSRLMVLYPDSEVHVHRKVVEPLQALAAAARKAGFELKLASGFRDFERQLSIWNAKALGSRAVLDSHGKTILKVNTLPPKDRVSAILRWSALPGASRHHWGTDIDVYDQLALPPGYQVQLTPDETSPGGVFGPFHQWLDQNLKAHGFFRPYARDQGGVSPERWHLSYEPLSRGFLASHSLETLEQTIVQAPIELKSTILGELSEIYQRFVMNISD